MVLKKINKTNLALYVFFAKNSIMKIAVIADEALKKELTAQGIRDGVKIEWLQEIIALPHADVYIDLSFSQNTERMEELKKLQPASIIVNSVTTTLNELPENFIRINGWPGFLKRPIIEAACADIKNKEITESAFACFNKTTEWVPDIIGFISARIVSMIINEAYFALQDEVSGKGEIDTAMKLGTNYPYGPFEWCDKIGIKNVYELLNAVQMDTKDDRYRICELLKNEALV